MDDITHLDTTEWPSPVQMPGPQPCEINMFGSCAYTLVGFAATVGRDRQLTRRPCRQCAALLCLWWRQLTWARVGSVVAGSLAPCWAGSALCLDASTDADDCAGLPCTLWLMCSSRMPIKAIDNTSCENEKMHKRTKIANENPRKKTTTIAQVDYSAHASVNQSRIPDYTGWNINSRACLFDLNTAVCVNTASTRFPHICSRRPGDCASLCLLCDGYVAAQPQINNEQSQRNNLRSIGEATARVARVMRT